MRALRSFALLGACAVLSSPLHAQAASAAAPAAQSAVIGEGTIQIRVRGAGFITTNQSEAVPSLGLGADRITTSDVVMAELEASWHAWSHVALSVSGTYPQQHKMFINGTQIGTFKQTPLTALLQYHLRPTAAIRPYLGAGVLVSPVSDVKLAASGIGRFDLPDVTVGPIGEAGFDIRIATGVFLNANARYAMMKSDLTIGGNTVSALTWNPIIVGGGIGFRF